MIDLLFPSYCVNCSKPGQYLCSTCQKKLKKSLPECYVCRKLSPHYLTHDQCNRNNIDAVFVGWQYDKIAKKILSQFKYRYAYKVSLILGALLTERLKESNFMSLIGTHSILTAMPSHIEHIRKRGFNHSSLIAAALSKSLNLPLKEQFIIRDKDSRYQSHLDLQARKELDSVFKCKEEFANREILLIDDVISTGTTINRAAKVLRGNTVKVIALFRGRPRYSLYAPPE